MSAESFHSSCYTKNFSGVPISENYHRVDADKKAFFEKYKQGTPQNNSFSRYFYDAVSRQDFANTLPETFEKELEQYVLQSMAKGYDANNVLKSVQTYLPAFLHSIKFQIYENEMERRRNVVFYRNTRPEAECRPVYTSLTAGDDTKNRRDAIDEQQANINDVCKRRIFSDESLLYRNPDADMLYNKTLNPYADMLFNKTLNRLGSKRSVPMVQNTELAPHHFLEQRFQGNPVQPPRIAQEKDLQRVTTALRDYKMPAEKVESILESIRQR